MLRQYLQYRSTAKGKQGLHSPHVFQFYNTVVKFKDSIQTRVPDELYKYIRRDRTVLPESLFGAGSKQQRKTISAQQLLRRSSTNLRWGRFLFQMSKFYGGNIILELGTNIGSGSAYLASGNSEANIFSFDGEIDYLTYAAKRLEDFNIRNVKLIEGDIKQTLPFELRRLNQIDMVYIDADHTYEATQFFFNLIKAHLHSKSVVILDDIYWSEGMTQIWTELCEREDVTVSIDLFFKGILFFDPKLSKQHFRIKHW